MLIVHGHGVDEWARLKMPCQIGFDNPFSFGVLKGDKLIGAAVFDNYRPAIKSVCISLAITDKRAMTRGFLRLLANYAFITLGANRMTAMIDEDNLSSIKITEKVGFKLEGIMRKGSPTGNNMCIYGMLKEECKWF